MQVIHERNTQAAIPPFLTSDPRPSDATKFKPKTNPFQQLALAISNKIKDRGMG
jgi:hypothetical protein